MTDDHLGGLTGHPDHILTYVVSWPAAVDINTFYALFSATCFTLLGLWWGVV